jgi:integrase
VRGRWVVLCRKSAPVFKYAYEAGLIDKPVRYGPNFNRPSKSAIRRERNEKPQRLFTAVELRTIIDAADQPLRAMILLAINAGLGNSDCGQLRFRNIDLLNGWLNYPRPKTGAARRCPLWQETWKALQQAIDQRPEPKDEGSRNFVFITKYGRPWHQDKTGEDGEKLNGIQHAPIGAFGAAAFAAFVGGPSSSPAAKAAAHAQKTAGTYSNDCQSRNRSNQATAEH